MNLDFSKYSKIDLKWLEVKKQVIERDRVCQVWKNLTKEEREYIVINFKEDFEMWHTVLDCMHKIPRSHDPSRIYDLNNIILGSRYFHTLIDSYRHPVTKEDITFEHRMKLMEKFSTK
jgi:hypothetical protein